MLFCSLAGHDTLARWAAAGTVVPFIVGVAQYFGALDFFNEGQLYSTIGNGNTFFMWLSISLPFCVSAAMHEKGAKKALFTILSAAILVFILVSKVHGAWAAALAGLAASAVFSQIKNSPGRIRQFIAFSVLAAIGFLNAVVIHVGRDIDAGQVSYSVATRLLHSTDVLRMGMAHPFSGWGIGTFMAFFPGYQTRNFGFEMIRAHQEYLQLFSETGVVGIVCFAAVAFVIIDSLLKHDHDASAGGAAAAGVLAAAAAASFSSFPVHEPASACYILAAVGIALGRPRVEPDVIPGMHEIPPVRKTITTICILLLVLLWTTFASAPLFAEIYMRKGVDLVRDGDYAGGRNCFITAARLNPMNGYANYLAGTSLLYTRDYEKAMTYLDKALALRDFGALHFVMGSVYLRQGDESRARYHFIKARDRSYKREIPVLR